MADILGSSEISQVRKDTYESPGISQDKKDALALDSAVVWRMADIPGSSDIS